MTERPNNRPIGVFDSGMGGLTVLAELVRVLPDENFVYLGDTARVPYGTRSPGVVQRYSMEAADHLLKNDIKLLVIACNTGTAHAEELLSNRLPVPVIGVVNPGVNALVSKTKTDRVGVIGTRSTIKSGAYEHAIKERNSGIAVFSRACPLFVPLVEEGWIDKKITGLVIQEYLSEIVREDIDSVILGCTHYPLLINAIRAEFPDLELIDSSVEIAHEVIKQLDKLDIRTSGKMKGVVRILLTDITEQMERLEKLFFGLTFQSVEEIRLSDIIERDAKN